MKCDNLLDPMSVSSDPRIAFAKCNKEAEVFLFIKDDGLYCFCKKCFSTLEVTEPDKVKYISKEEADKYSLLL